MSQLEEIKARTKGHTEGPLVVDDEEQTVRVGYAGEIMFDRSGESHSYWMECRPNAELFAAAPKLLAALEAVEESLTWLDAIQEGDNNAPRNANAGGVASFIRSAIKEALQ